MSCAHSAPALLASQIFLDHVKLFFFFALGPLHQLSPLPRMLSPWIRMAAQCSPPNMNCSERPPPQPNHGSPQAPGTASSLCWITLAEMTSFVLSESLNLDILTAVSCLLELELSSLQSSLGAVS